MGRGAKWDGQGGHGEQWSSQAHAGRSWAIWPGAYSPKAGHNPPWKRGGNQEASSSRQRFPAYDSRPPADSNDRKLEPPERTVTRDSGDADGALVPSVQKALNGARKAESRVLRLQKEKDRAEKQWQDYVRDSRLAYARERERHTKALAHFEKEITEALEQQRTARVMLKHAAFQEALPAEAPSAMEVSDAGVEWEQMVAAWEQEQASMDGAVLRRALMEMEDAGPASRTPQARRALPRSPVPTSTRAAAPQAPAAEVPADGGDSFGPSYSGSSPMARVDPYPIPSPRFAAKISAEAEMAAAMASSGEPVPGTSPVHPAPRPHAEGQRQGVKAATMQAPGKPVLHSTIADKLEAKRSALLVFGRPPGLAAPPGAPPAPAGHMPSGIVDDDLDDDPAEDVTLHPVEESTAE